ncbi:ATP binding protein [Aureococcus anophagefferens]|nr:ATP binding protein [Aureococcus anophagefferens]
MPAPLTYVAGVQIGRCESRVCVVRREASGELTTVQFVQSDTGARSTPCVIALSATGEYVIGEAAETQMAKNADATVPSVLATLPRAADGAALAEAARRGGAAGCSVAVSDVAGDVEIVLTPPPNEDEDEPPAKPGKLRGDGAAKAASTACCRPSPPRRRARRPRDGEALYGHCVTFLKRRQKIDVAEGGKKAQRKLRVACVRAAKVLARAPRRRSRPTLADGADARMTRARFDDLAGPIYAKAGALGATAAAAFAASATKPAKILPLLCGGAAAAIHKAFVGAFEGFELVEDPGLLGSQVEVDELAVHGAATQAALLAFGAQPLIDEAATKVAKGAKKYASARADFCLATAALPVLGGGLRLAGDGAAAFVVAFDGDAPLAVLDCSKFAGASKVELAATLDEKANLKLVATVDGDENPVSLDVPASA